MRHAEYGPLLTQAYDLDKPVAPPDDLAAYLSFIGDDAPVLAAMCGSGRFLVPLLEAGIDVDGVDASVDMLSACKRKLAEHNLPDRTHHAFLQAFDLPRRYACAFIASVSFGLIVDRTDAMHALLRVREHLVPGGRFQFEVQTPRVAEPTRLHRAYVRSWVRDDGARIVLTDTALSYEDGVMESIGRYELFVDGRLATTELDAFPNRFYTSDEIIELTEQAGFGNVDVSDQLGGGFVLRVRAEAIP